MCGQELTGSGEGSISKYLDTLSNYKLVEGGFIQLRK
jgi:hypothetical protein